MWCPRADIDTHSSRTQSQTVKRKEKKVKKGSLFRLNGFKEQLYTRLGTCIYPLGS